MRILGISALNIWGMGANKGMPSVFYGQTGFVKAGHEVHYLVWGKENREEVYSGIHVHYFRVPGHNYSGRNKLLVGLNVYFRWLTFQLYAFRPAFKLLKTKRFDVIYGHTSYGVPIAFLMSRLFKTYYIYREYGTFLATYLKRKKTLSLLLRGYDLLGFILPCDYMILTDDGSQTDLFAKKFKVLLARVRHWRNGVEKELFQKNVHESNEGRNIPGVPKDHKVLLMVARLSHVKRFDRLISALPKLVEKYPKVSCVLVGDGEERARLETLARNLGVNDKVVFAGAVQRSELSRYYAAANIFLSLGQGPNVGNPLIEAMMMGKCIVTLDNAGTGTVIKDGVNGVLLPEEDTSRLPEVLYDLLIDEEKRKRLGDAAFQYARENFISWDERMQMEVELVEELVRNGRHN